MEKIKNWWKNLSRKNKILWSLAVIVFITAWYLLIMWWSVWSWDYVDSGLSSEQDYFKSCDIVAVSIQGDIVGHSSEAENGDDSTIVSAEDAVYTLGLIDKENPPVVMLDITSLGGAPAPSKELADFVAQMKTPVVTSIREAGLSGGYYIASQSDEIFASPFSDIGSIGVSMSYLDESRLNEKEGYTWNSLSTGKFKDSGSPEKPLTKEERALFERDLKIIHDTFVADVARGRNIPIEKVRQIADGSSVMPEKALELKLIDGIKHQWEVIEYLKEKYNTGDEICWE
jgi:signal peptide peptidase SppA